MNRKKLLLMMASVETMITFIATMLFLKGIMRLPVFMVVLIAMGVVSTALVWAIIKKGNP